LRNPVSASSVAPDARLPAGLPGGAATVTLNTTTMATHTPTALGGSGGSTLGPAGNTWGSLAGRTPPLAYQSGNPNVPLSTAALDPVGQNAPHNNLQPHLTLNFIIATTGIYPIRD